MEFELMASMMCADYAHLGKEVKALDEGGIDSFHIDIMDGRYVPNYAMSLNDLRCIRSLTKKPLDVHLMVEHPSNTIEIFIDNLKKGDTIYIHPEAEYHPSTALQKIKYAGLIPGIAINPGTSFETVHEMLYIVRRVLVMAVNPGSAGQMFLPYVGRKIEKLLSVKDEMKFELYWDGACGMDKIRQFAPRGMKGFVLGTTLLFGKPQPYGVTLRAIREMRFE